MNHARKIALVLAAALALMLSVLAQQPDTGSQPQSQTMQGMQGMQGQMQQGQRGQMHGMMQDCHKNMQTMRQSNDQARRDIAAARQSNDPAKMRAALAEADKALAAMNDPMKPCMSMMDMMQDRHDKGMMPEQKSQPPQQ